MKAIRYVLLWGCCCFAGMAAETPSVQWQYAVQGTQIGITCRVAPDCTLEPSAVQVRLNGTPLANPPAAETPYGIVYDASRIWRWEAAFHPPLTALDVTFQCCRAGLCLPPETVDLLVVADTLPEGAEALPPALAQELTRWRTLARGEGWMDAPAFLAWLGAAFSENGMVHDNAVVASPLSGGFWALFWLILLGGLGLNLTPCVLPMIPVNLAIIGAGRDAPECHGRPGWRGFRRGLAYGLGIALTYGVLGGLAALGGAGFGVLNSCWWFNLIVAGVVLLLAWSLVSARGLDLSRFAGSWVEKVRKVLPPWLGAFFLGCVAALLAGACVAPVVVGVVVVAADLYATGSRAGLLLPLALGAAMALPWPLAGAGLSVLPAPGRWMVWVKRGFALLLLLVAGYFGMLAWRQYAAPRDAAAELAALTRTLEDSARSPDPVLLHFSASWCKNCAAMTQQTWTAPEVQSALKMHRVRLISCRTEDLTDPANRALLKRWQLQGLPAWVLLIPQR